MGRKNKPRLIINEENKKELSKMKNLLAASRGEEVTYDDLIEFILEETKVREKAREQAEEVRKSIEKEAEA